jgi:hypothetical protein
LAWVVAVICPGLVGAALSCISFACELVPWAITTPPGVGSAAEALMKPPTVRAESMSSEAAVAVKSFVFMSKVYPDSPRWKREEFPCGQLFIVFADW